MDNLAHIDHEKMAWYLHWMGLAFTAIEVFLKASKQLNQANLLDVLLVPQVYNAHRFKLNMQPYNLINQQVFWCNQLNAFQQAHPDKDLTYSP